ncbi:MAG TPA: acetyl-CoA carboxylase biotin carboxyl carrier protein subunit, partial [Fimbriimonas sp.]
KSIVSEVSGRVVEVLVGAGEVVGEGRELLVVESMKMEIPVTAPSPGTIEALHVTAGDAVEPGTLLARLRPA